MQRSRPDGLRILTSARRPSPWKQGELALEWMLPSGVPARPHVDRDSLVVANRDVAAHATPTQRPDPATWAATLLQASLQILGGQRPVHQLLRWLDPPVYRELATAAAEATRKRNPLAPGSLRVPLISSIHTSYVAEDAVEACAVLLTRGRSRAAVIRLDGVADRWRCTRLAIL